MDMQRGFCIGPWTVSPLTGEIEADGRSVHLEPKVMEVLVVLAENAESVVLRETLLDRVWGPRAAISDEPLTRCIAQLRQSLGDSSRDPRFIQTVPKRGYRLIVPAEPVGDAAAPAAAPGAMPPAPAAGGHDRRPRLWQGVVLTGALAVVGLAAYIVLPLVDRPADSVDSCNIEARVDSVSPLDPQAYAFCAEGAREIERRDANSLRYAMRYLRMALEREPGYGSAIVQLARSYVLLPTYDESARAEECRYDDNAPDPDDCYDGAIKLLIRNRDAAPYIHDYAAGIEGYVYTKQRNYRDALGAFRVAEAETPMDADMWQWNSQFRAAVADLDGALEAIEQAVQLNPDSPVIRDRYGVVLMWLGRNDAARQQFAAAAALPHQPYAASELVWRIREQRWPEVEAKLREIARLRQAGDTAWIGDFVAGLRDGDDPSVRERAAAAVEHAVQRGYLVGQYEYGAWLYLGETERAFEAAYESLNAGPAAARLDVEFLFAPETEALRAHPRFGEILDALGLLDYWSDDARNCPSIVEAWGRADWCDRARPDRTR